MPVDDLIDRTYAVARVVAQFRLRQQGACRFICTPKGHPVFALVERKNEIQKEDEVPLRKITSELPRCRPISPAFALLLHDLLWFALFPRVARKKREPKEIVKEQQPRVLFVLPLCPVFKLRRNGAQPLLVPSQLAGYKLFDDRLHPHKFRV